MQGAFSRNSWQCLSSSLMYLEGSECVTRESVVSGHTSVSSTVPIARFSEEEKKFSVIKAPHYEGIGPVDESGIPIAIRTVRSNTHTPAKPSGLQALHQCRGVSLDPFLSSWYVTRLMKGDYFLLSAAFEPILKALSLTRTISVSLLPSPPQCASYKDELGRGLCFHAARSLMLTCQSVCVSACYLC